MATDKNHAAVQASLPFVCLHLCFLVKLKQLDMWNAWLLHKQNTVHNNFTVHHLSHPSLT